MAENKGVLPSSNVNTLGNANNKWENVYANKFTGAVAGNAATATALQTARSINGTNFNGTGNITTANWGTARNISIADATATNTGTGVSVNGSGNVTLKLPATIKASITGGCSGNAGTATKLATARTINIQDSSATNTGTGASFDGSGNATIKLPATIKANVTGNCSGSSGSCTGNAATATKATRDSAGQQINTTYIKGLSVSGATLTITKGNGTTSTIDLIPAGTMQMFAGNTIPAGWLLCDGSAVSRTNYAKLFSAIGTTWGAGNGSTTFNLPNSIGRFAEGAATSGSYKSAGLPNITGKISFYGNRGGVQKQEGAFDPDDTIANQVPALNEALSLNSVDRTITFYASRSSSIYGNSTTVQPPSFTTRYIIKY